MLTIVEYMKDVLKVGEEQTEDSFLYMERKIQLNSFFLYV